MSKKPSLIITLGLALLCSLVIAQTLPGKRQQAAPTSAPQASSATVIPALTPSAPIMLKRDLKLYVKAGPFNLGSRVNEPARQAALTGIRDFLWSHRQQQRRAHLTINSQSDDGPTTAENFLVEPDHEGRWHVVIESSGGAVERFYVMERIEVPEDGVPSLPRRSGDKGQAGGGTGNGIHLKAHAEAKMGVIL